MLRERRDRVEPGAVPHREPAAPLPAPLSPAGVLALQRSLGNQGVQRLIARAAPSAAPTTGWPPAEAVKTARAAGNVADEENGMRDAIVVAAPSATFPQGLPVQLPQTTDVHIDLAYDAEAYTRAAEAPAHPDNYWHWMHWGKNSVRDTEANTLAAITHELVHAKQIHGWWQDWNGLDPATRDPWEVYMGPMDEPARWAGPQELEAYMTGLDFLPKLTPVERRAALQQLFVAFVKTAKYVPPPGVTPEATTAATAPVILDAFNAQTTIQPEYGEWFWHALLGASLDRDGWLRFLRELLPIAAAGYADAGKQWFYDSSLERAGLTWAEVATP